MYYNTYRIREVSEEEFDQAVERLSCLKGRLAAYKIAGMTAGVLGPLVFILMIVISILVFAVPLESIHDLDKVPLLKTFMIYGKDLWNALPTTWYIRLGAILLALYLPPIIVYQIVRPVVYVLFRREKNDILLHENKIANAKKLFRMARRLWYYDEPDTGPVCLAVLVAILFVAAAVFGGGELKDVLWAIVVGAVCGFVFFFLLSMSCYGNVNMYSSIHRRSEREIREDEKQLKGLEEIFYGYWVEVDPEEKAEVERRREWERKIKDEEESRQRYSGIDFSYPSSRPLTDQDHDDLDAVAKAIHESYGDNWLDDM